MRTLFVAPIFIVAIFALLIAGLCTYSARGIAGALGSVHRA